MSNGTGIVMITAMTGTIGEHCYPCDGSTLVITEHQDLYNAIGDSYNDGNEPSGEFRLPDIADVPVTNGPSLRYFVYA